MGALTPVDVQLFAQAVRQLAPLDDDDLAAAQALLHVRELKRGQFLLRAGELATEGAIVAQGLLREYFVTESGTERTKALVTEGGPTGSLADLLRGQPSKAFIAAEEPSRLLLIPFAASVALAERNAGWRYYGDQLLKHILLRKADREYELLGLDAAQRYAAFVARCPGIEARVAARHIASYLGITPVHLSRLRRRRLAAAANEA